MNIQLDNIAKIGHANIDIHGITVIGGENNTGKSTIGKVLFSTFNGLYDIETKIEKDKLSAIRAQIARIFNFIDMPGDTLLGRASRIRHDDLNTMAEIFYTSDTENTLQWNEYILSVFRSVLDEALVEHIDDSYIEELASAIKRIKSIDNKDSTSLILTRIFYSEFNNQINNVHHKGIGRIDIHVKDKQIGFLVQDNQINLNNDISFLINTDAIYIDDPFIIDDIDMHHRRLRLDYRNSVHRTHLLRLLMPQSEQNIVEELINHERINSILERLKNICPGQLTTNKEWVDYTFNGAKINVRNLSSGIKAFVIIKELIINSKINQNGLLILDEPEIHLHPEWQLVLAELIVLLQKEFNLHILLTTHSPYFFNAIEVYAAKHAIADKCKYYLSKLNNQTDTVTFDDVTNNIELIYQKLARPLQELENLRYRDGDIS